MLVCVEVFFGAVEAAEGVEDSADFWTDLSCAFSEVFSEGLDAVFSGAFSGVGSTGFERLKKPVRVVVAGVGAVFSGVLLSAAQPVPGEAAIKAMLSVTPRALLGPRLARVKGLLIEVVGVSSTVRPCPSLCLGSTYRWSAGVFAGFSVRAGVCELSRAFADGRQNGLHGEYSRALNVLRCQRLKSSLGLGPRSPAGASDQMLRRCGKGCVRGGN